MSNEEHFTALGLDIPTINGTGRMIRRPAWHYDYDFSTDKNCDSAIAASVKGNIPLMLKNGKLQCKMNSKVL